MNHKITIYILTLVVGISIIGSLEYYHTNSSGDYALEVFENEGGWGYQIYDKGKLVIKQNHIPGIKHKNTFKTEGDATKIGYLVIKRLRKKEPPSISKGDLKRYEVAFE